MIDEIIISILRTEMTKNSTEINRTKEEGIRWGQHEDWPWNGIILSAATQGGSARWLRNVAPRYNGKLSWNSLKNIPDDERQRRFESVGRFWRRTAQN